LFNRYWWLWEERNMYVASTGLSLRNHKSETQGIRQITAQAWEDLLRVEGSWSSWLKRGCNFCLHLFLFFWCKWKTSFPFTTKACDNNMMGDFWLPTVECLGEQFNSSLVHTKDFQILANMTLRVEQIPNASLNLVLNVRKWERCRLYFTLSCMCTLSTYYHVGYRVCECSSEWYHVVICLWCSTIDNMPRKVYDGPVLMYFSSIIVVDGGCSRILLPVRDWSYSIWIGVSRLSTNNFYMVRLSVFATIRMCHGWVTLNLSNLPSFLHYLFMGGGMY